MTILIDTLTPPAPRHPEKRHRNPRPMPPKPPWLRVRIPAVTKFSETQAALRRNRLVTVCEEASCPNIADCWSQSHATVMILGDICTRACSFCNVRTGIPGPVDADEAIRVAALAVDLGLRHIVITSVDRDDLDDGGARHFAAVIAAVRADCPETSIEVLTPDFLRKPGALELVIEARPDVFNHNIETVPGLYPRVRPGARYYHSLRLLEAAKTLEPTLFTKSGLMVGLGENRDQILQVMDDMRCAGVDFLTIGQYLQPTPQHYPIDRFVPPEEFDELKAVAAARGFIHVAASPLTRSSFHAGDDFAALQRARRKSTASPS